MLGQLAADEAGVLRAVAPGDNLDPEAGVRVAPGRVHSYTDNGDGTVTDNQTGLTWEKKSDDGSIHDKDDRLLLG